MILFHDKENKRKLTQEVSRLKDDLEKANRWTNSYRIVNNVVEEIIVKR